MSSSRLTEWHDARHSKYLVVRSFLFMIWAVSPSYLHSWWYSSNFQFPPWSFTDLNPETESPSSVKVPVLSKIMIETLPATLILGGSIQKILHFLSYLTAKITPEVIAAGRAGGIAIVIKSMNLLKVPQGVWYFRETSMLQSIPIKAMKPSVHAKRRESQWNLNFEGFGNNILLTSSPFVVS